MRMISTPDNYLFEDEPFTELSAKGQWVWSDLNNSSPVSAAELLEPSLAFFFYLLLAAGNADISVEQVCGPVVCVALIVPVILVSCYKSKTGMISQWKGLLDFAPVSLGNVRSE